MEKKRIGDGGFSLVELIIVIAIMAVLVGVLAPQFIKYVEHSRRAVDIQNAGNIREAVFAECTDGTIPTSGADYYQPGADPVLSSITDEEIPKVRSDVGDNRGGYFYVEWDIYPGVCKVYNVKPDGTNDDVVFDLTDSDKALEYKNH